MHPEADEIAIGARFKMSELGTLRPLSGDTRNDVVDNILTASDLHRSHADPVEHLTIEGSLPGTRRVAVIARDDHQVARGNPGTT